VKRADRSAATVRKDSHIACSLASRCSHVNDFLPTRFLPACAPPRRDFYTGKGLAIPGGLVRFVVRSQSEGLAPDS
jgi:hypothetical protein